MLILDIKNLFDEVEFPCTFSELITQCKKTNQPSRIIDELRERFEEECQVNIDCIGYDDFPEYLESYDEEFFGQDD